ncbi:MAG: hypothetical protein CFE26_03030 [Verrucomicrobiales bacterium VVV1]|nr:MAG: hypothetical protein CFE26_03030 [Verrucomicrobiales bacterium VVV1]
MGSGQRFSKAAKETDQPLKRRDATPIFSAKGPWVETHGYIQLSRCDKDISLNGVEKKPHGREVSSVRL